MSCVAWDGYSIAADRQTTNHDLKFMGSKLCRLNLPDDDMPAFAAWTGTDSLGRALVEWFEKAADPKQWPEFQKGDEWTRLIIVSSEGAHYYESFPLAIPVSEPFFAWGAGRDLAIGAMAHGATAKEAVEIACRFNIYCSGGVEVIELRERARDTNRITNCKLSDNPLARVYMAPPRGDRT